MEKILKKAKEGGYDVVEDAYNYNIYSEMFLKPKFWQALGKAEGWGNMYSKYSSWVDESDGSWNKGELQKWEHEMHQFIDHLIAEKPIDEFFENLLSEGLLTNNK